MKCWVATEKQAEEVAESEGSGQSVAIIKEKMHREIFENLPEFDGF